VRPYYFLPTTEVDGAQRWNDLAKNCETSPRLWPGVPSPGNRIASRGNGCPLHLYLSRGAVYQRFYYGDPELCLMKIAFFGSSILSAYWNGAATYYRGIVRALHRMGHSITFYEPDAFDRQAHIDLVALAGSTWWFYDNSSEVALQQVESAGDADWIIKASGVGAFDELLEKAVLEGGGPPRWFSFWDVDAPANT